jgi:general secretion pathway protein A
MYEAYWKLRRRPFEPRSSAEFYYPSETHQAALLKLRYAIENRRSLGVLAGFSGIGKSQLLNLLREQLPEFAGPWLHVAYPALSSSELVQYIARQFRQDSTPASPASLADAIHQLESSLFANLQAGRHAVIVIEEAECLENYGSLEVLRLLLNLAANHSDAEAAMSIILSGQPILFGQLERYPALEQRLAVRCAVQAFSNDESMAYISHRLRQADGQMDQIFHTEALESICYFSEGIPRRINSLCDLALMVGFAQEVKLIKASLIDSVHRELAPA